MGGLEIYLRICSIIGFVSAALGTSSFFYALSIIGWNNVTIHTSKTLNKQTCFINQRFFLVISHLILGIAEALMCIYELFLIINPVRFQYHKNGYSRGIFYVLVGFIVLGVAAGLGISAGIISLLSAVLTFINTSLIKCDCMRMEKSPAKIEDQV